MRKRRLKKYQRSKRWKRRLMKAAAVLAIALPLNALTPFSARAHENVLCTKSTFNAIGDELRITLNVTTDDQTERYEDPPEPITVTDSQGRTILVIYNSYGVPITFPSEGQPPYLATAPNMSWTVTVSEADGPASFVDEFCKQFDIRVNGHAPVSPKMKSDARRSIAIGLLSLIPIGTAAQLLGCGTVLATGVGAPLFGLCLGLTGLTGAATANTIISGITAGDPPRTDFTVRATVAPVEHTFPLQRYGMTRDLTVAFRKVINHGLTMKAVTLAMQEAAEKQWGAEIAGNKEWEAIQYKDAVRFRNRLGRLFVEQADLLLALRDQLNMNGVVVETAPGQDSRALVSFQENYLSPDDYFGKGDNPTADIMTSYANQLGIAPEDREDTWGLISQARILVTYEDRRPIPEMTTLFPDTLTNMASQWRTFGNSLQGN